MLRFTKPLICPSRSSSTGGPRLQSGYALLFVMMVATILLISLTVALPTIYQEGQREREEELVFRGTQYARAIARFHLQFQRYPARIEELTQLTNGMRFLRKEYTDPMTSSGKWRFIHANAMGALLDSKTMSSGAGGQSQPGTGQSAGGFGSSGQPGMGGSGFGQPGMGGSAFGQPGMSGSGFGQSGMEGSGFGQTGLGGSAFGQSTGSLSPNSNPGGNLPNTPQSSSFFGQSAQGGGTFIVGVASTSHKQSIRIWNQKTHYDEWEFLGSDLGTLGLAPVTGQQQGVSGQPGQPGQSGMFGQPPRGNPAMPGQPGTAPPF